MEAESSIKPLALLFLAVMGFLIFKLPRRHAFIPLFVMACFMPLGQIVMIVGLNFHLFRILLLLGIIRVFVRGEARQIKIVSFDKLFLVWILVSIVFGTLAKPSFNLFINRMGDAYNAACTYFFLRCVVKEWSDVVGSIRVLAILAIPLACLLLIEKSTGHNVLSIFGGVPEMTVEREGRLRCQGAFRHPILTGTFGATLFPLVAALCFYNPRFKKLAIAGGVSSIIIVVASASSGPLLALLASVFGLVFWRFRSHIRVFRWTVIILILVLAAVMNAPVYYLIARISEITGGTGWHRSYLIEVALHHLNEWWLFGTTYTAHWGPGGQVIAADPDNMDITNHFIMEGVKGGLLKMVLFGALIAKSFKTIGQRVIVIGKIFNVGFVTWALGVSLFAHCVSFISVPYFDQIIVFWYWLLAAITTLSCPVATSTRLRPRAKTTVVSPKISYSLLFKTKFPLVSCT